MSTLKDVVEAFLAAREYDRATLSRLHFSFQKFADRELADITPDAAGAALVGLAEPGRLKPIRNGTTTPAGKPLAGATLKRYISQLQSIYKYACRRRSVPCVATWTAVPVGILRFRIRVFRGSTIIRRAA
ncbi:hypothetical protein [Thioalkalivibrio sp.]|uniref:hypothetical protein n=1 Tax=Thioalkalivibrio sp. TaxID=2093813 RepID=UPI0035689677